MSVFRIHIRPAGGKGNSRISFAYCLKYQVLGLGWQVPLNSPSVNSLTWDEFEPAAIAEYGDAELARVRYLKRRLKSDDLVWTRCDKGSYFLARTLTGWEYFTNPEAEDADIVNIVRCQLMAVPIDQVPGKVVACFRAPRAIQAIADDTVKIYSKSLWNRLSNTTHYPITQNLMPNIFSYLTSEDAEDIIFIYLQFTGWIVIPNSRKADTMAYEFYAINSITKEKAVVQVKTGYSAISVNHFRNISNHVFLFQTNGLYHGAKQPNVTCLAPSEVESFMRNNIDILPGSIAHWLEQ